MIGLHLFLYIFFQGGGPGMEMKNQQQGANERRGMDWAVVEDNQKSKTTL